MDARSKDLVNSSSGGSFYRLRLSKAKVVLERILSAKREYDDTEVTSLKERTKSIPTEERDNSLESRICKLEEALQSVSESRQHPPLPIQAHFQIDQVNHRQNTREVWSSHSNWNPGSQREVYQQEYQQCREWSRAEEYRSFQSYTEPYPAFIQIPSWPMGSPPNQPYPEIQSHEFYPPTFQPDYPSHYPSFPSHPYQTCPPETGDHFPTWSDEDRQTQHEAYYSDQICPDQPLCQPHPQQSLNSNTKEPHHASSAGGEDGELAVTQQNTGNCTRSSTEMVMQIQHTCEEQQSNMDDMIKQVALLTEMMKEIRENRAKSEADGRDEEEEGTRKAEKESLAKTERRSETPLEETKTSEIESDEGEMETEEKSITTPPDNDEPQEALEEVFHKPPERDEEVVEQEGELDNALFYLQLKKVHIPGKKVEEFITTSVNLENESARRPPQLIDKAARSCYQREGEPEQKENWSRSNAAKAIYWDQTSPWPEQPEVGRPLYNGLRPKERKKILGTYRHHRKKLVLKVGCL